MTMFAYYRTTDNTIAEQELEEYSATSGTTAQQVAEEFAKAFGFTLLSLGSEKWDNEDWEIGYRILERDGYFTRERQEELFDTRIIGSLDRIDTDYVDGWDDGLDDYYDGEFTRSDWRI